MNDSKLIDTTSPMEAASGVARLSGFRLYFCENRITATSTKSVNNEWNGRLVTAVDRARCTRCDIPRTKQDDVAVNMAEAVNSMAFSK